MPFRISACLILGLTVAIVGGCSGFGHPSHRANFRSNGEGLFGYPSQPDGCIATTAANVEQELAQPERPPLEMPCALQPQIEELNNRQDNPQPPELELNEGTSSDPRVDSSFSQSRSLTGEPATPDQVELSASEFSVLNNSTRRVNATPVSTSKQFIEPLEQEVYGPDLHGAVEEPLEFQREMLPAKSFDTTEPAPLVLRAVPNENHIVHDRRLADKRGVASFGLPTTNNVEFKRLPCLEEDETTDGQNYPSTLDAPFANPSVDKGSRNIKTAPQNQSIPKMETGLDGFTKSTSYLAPSENSPSSLLLAAATVEAAVAKLKPDDGPKKDTPPIGAISQLIRQKSRVKIVNPKKPVEQVQILRMRASTPLDRQNQVPPLVSIKSIMEPVIVRNIHPDASPPVASLESSSPHVQPPPFFKQDPLKDSTPDLSTRHSNKPKDPETIDR